MQEELQKLREEFNQRIKALEDKYKSQEEFKPEYGDEYWAISSRGEPDKYRWCGDIIDKGAFNLGNIFRTKEEAEFEAERIKVLRELEKMGRSYAYDLYDLCICLYANDKVGCRIETDAISMYGKYYFRSEEEVKEAIEKIGEDRIKKYLFGVED